MATDDKVKKKHVGDQNFEQRKDDATSDSGNYDNDIPVDENVVNYRTNKTAREEGKKVALKDNEGKLKRKG
jgi:hypothetical protein